LDLKELKSSSVEVRQQGRTTKKEHQMNTTEIKTTYTATAPDGTEITRKSKTDYKHAVMAQDASGKWFASFHTTIRLAWKQEAKDLEWLDRGIWINVVLVSAKAAA
jgi:hypothetical protein